VSIAAALGWWVFLSVVAVSVLASLGAWARRRHDAQEGQELRKAARAYGTTPEAENCARSGLISTAGHPRGPKGRVKT
jgi:hypothetical protein